MHLKANPWLLWLLGALLFFSEYLVRTSSSVMVSDIMHAFSLNAAGLGVLSACFYYPYTIMQIPVGIIVDRFATGKILTIMAVLFAAACFSFACASKLWIAKFARIIMGFSAAFAFVGTLKLVTEKFDAKVLGFLAGATQAVGMLGAAAGEGPVAYMVQHLGWRKSMVAMSSFIAFIALILLMFAWYNDHKKSQSCLDPLSQIKLSIIKNKQVLLNALFSGLIYAPTLVFGELWGVDYLSIVYKISHVNAAAAISWVFIGWGIGGPMQGLISDKIAQRKPLLYFSVVTSLLLLLIILRLDLSYNMLIFCMFCYGLANAGLVVSYAIAGEINPAEQTGTTIAFTNMSSVLLGAICQPFIGWLLVYNWSGGHDLAGVPVYNVQTYKSAMLFLPLLLVLACFVCYFIKETNCSKEHE